MSSLLSIIIPCYNSEKTLELTLESVYNQKYLNWEAIIVNDGSKDTTESIAESWVNKDARFKYYSKENEGLGKTRNYGISKAKGAFILPLDSDNLVDMHFASEALNVFEKNPDVGVVHGNAEYFGEKTGVWKVDKFDFEKMLITNYIDACAIFKKSLFDEVGGYDVKIPFQGVEDWELWLAFGSINVKFYHLNKVTFKYYVNNNSMIRSFSDEMFKQNKNYIVNKYSNQYYLHFIKNKTLLDTYLQNPLVLIKRYLKNKIS